MARVIEKRHRERHSERVREYRWTDNPNSGFSFDVDENGNPIRTEGNAHNWDMLETWVTEDKLVDNGVQVREWFYTVPTLIKCDCGEELSCDGFTNPCE